MAVSGPRRARTCRTRATARPAKSPLVAPSEPVSSRATDTAPMAGARQRQRRGRRAARITSSERANHRPAAFCSPKVKPARSASVAAGDRARAEQRHQDDRPDGGAQAPHVHDEPGPGRRAAEVGQPRRPGQQVEVLQDGDGALPGKVAEGGGDGPGDDHDAHAGRVRQPQALPGHTGPQQHGRDARDQPEVGRGEVVGEGGLEDGQRGDAEHDPGPGEPVAVPRPGTASDRRLARPLRGHGRRRGQPAPLPTGTTGSIGVPASTHGRRGAICRPSSRARAAWPVVIALKLLYLASL